MKYLKGVLFIALILSINSSVPTINDVMEYISTIVNKYSKIKDIKVWAGEANYDHQLKPSVAKY